MTGPIHWTENMGVNDYNGKIYTIEISGMGVDYELACQYLLWRLYTELKGMTFETPKELSTFIDANPKTREIIDTVGPTGAMFSAVVSHLHRLLKKGYNGWVYDIPPDRLTMISKKILKMFDEHYL